MLDNSMSLTYKEEGQRKLLEELQPSGSKAIPISLAVIVPAEKRLSVTVGIVLESGDKVPT